MHLPNKVFRQFGKEQQIPEHPETYETLHELTRSGFQGANWADLHKDWIELWSRRASALVQASLVDPYVPMVQYMRWYSVHTVRYISLPVNQQLHRDSLRCDVGRYEYMMDSITCIVWKSCDALAQGST